MTTTDPTPDVVELLRSLRLPHMRKCAPDLLATAKAQRWEPAEAVRALLVEELSGRQRSSIASRRKAAGFPTGKTFEAWNDSVSSIPEPTQRSLRTLEWIDRHENLVVCGPSGHGQDPLPRSLGPVRHRRRSPCQLVQPRGTSVPSCAGTAPTTPRRRAIRRIMRAELIVIDDIGLLPVAAETAEALYRVVDAAYERRSLAISSNLHPSGFDELMPKTIANSTVDRLMHHAHLVLTSGDSIRLTDATTGKGVKPLS